jgi:hypothetical protein
VPLAAALHAAVAEAARDDAVDPWDAGNTDFVDWLRGLDRRGRVGVFDSASYGELSVLPGAVRRSVAFDSRSNVALLLGPRGPELRPCDGCRSPRWLVQNVGRRVTRTPGEVAGFERNLTPP